MTNNYAPHVWDASTSPATPAGTWSNPTQSSLPSTGTWNNPATPEEDFFENDYDPYVTTFSVMLDNKPHSTKPDDREVPCIKSRLAQECANPVETSATPLLNKIRQGYTICPAIIKPKLNPNGKPSHNAAGFISQQLFLVDIDNAHPKEKDPATGKHRKLTIEEGYITPAQAIEICQKNEIMFLFIYKTFSYTPIYEKYRIGFLMEEPITDDTERLHVIQTLIGLFGTAADTSCTNADRVMHGGRPDCIIIDDTGTSINKQVILNLWNENQKNFHPPLPDTLPPSLSPFPKSTPATTSKPATKLDNYNPSDFDADPDELLGLIDPNNCNYDNWKRICAAFKGAGGTLTSWMQWCSEYTTDKPNEDKSLYNNMNGTTINSLKYYAKQLAPNRYAQYIDNLNNQQHQAIADARYDLGEGFCRRLRIPLWPLRQSDTDGRESGPMDRPDGVLLQPGTGTTRSAARPPTQVHSYPVGNLLQDWSRNANADYP